MPGQAASREERVGWRPAIVEKVAAEFETRQIVKRVVTRRQRFVEAQQRRRQEYLRQRRMLQSVRITPGRRKAVPGDELVFLIERLGLGNNGKNCPAAVARSRAAMAGTNIFSGNRINLRPVPPLQSGRCSTPYTQPKEADSLCAP